MKISVKVKVNSREERVERISKNEFVLFVKAAPIEGKANAAVIELLSEYFEVPQSRVSIIQGYKSKNKIINIEEGKYENKN